MKVLESPPDTLITRSQRTMRGEQGYQDAEYVYGCYLSSGSNIEILALLSLACRTKPVREGLGIITPRVVKDLKTHNLIGTASLNVERWLTNRGHVAVSMIDAELTDGDIDSNLNEPFVDHSILPTLHREQWKITGLRDVYYYTAD